MGLQWGNERKKLRVGGGGGFSPLAPPSVCAPGHIDGTMGSLEVLYQGRTQKFRKVRTPYVGRGSTAPEANGFYMVSVVIFGEREGVWSGPPVSAPVHIQCAWLFP